MTDINLKDFDKKNWDEFVHLRALQDVINQENAVNNEQNQQITQNTNDVTTAKQTATDAKTSADAAQSTANDAKTTADNAQSTANDNKTALDGLTDKVTTAQNTADDAKNAAAENKTNLDTVTNIATGAQKTATILSDELNKLDNEVLKKNDTASYSGENKLLSINDIDITNESGASTNLQFYATNGDVYNQLILNVGALNIDIDLSNINTFVFKIEHSFNYQGYVSSSLKCVDSSGTTAIHEGGIDLMSDGSLRLNLDQDINNFRALKSPVSFNLNINAIVKR